MAIFCHLASCHDGFRSSFLGVKGQVLYGTLVGQVRDQSGAAVPGADVTVINEGTNLTRQTSSSDTGAYSFPTLSVGNYTVKVSLPGFRQFVRTGVPVTANSTIRVEADMQIGELADDITVSAATAPVLQADKAEVRAEVSEKELANLPIPQGRNYQECFGTCRVLWSGILRGPVRPIPPTL